MPTQTNPWDAYTYWAGKLLDLATFDEDERDYKLRLGKLVSRARVALLEGDAEWMTHLRKALHSREDNITNWRAKERFFQWINADPDRARSLLRKLWESPTPTPDTVRDFVTELVQAKISGRSTILSLATVLLLAIDATAYPPYRHRAFVRNYALVGDAEPEDADPGTVWVHAMEFLDRIVTEAKHRALPIRDRLDAQGVVWMLKGSDAPKAWPEDQRRRFAEYVGAEASAGGHLDDAIDDDEPTATQSDGLLNLARELYFDEAELRRIEEMLHDKRQVIFYGPPGTGKTYVAKKLAAYFARDGGTVEKVQFHPSYSYEDFVEGYRPTIDSGAATFQLTQGPLRRIAEAADRNRARQHVLLIDEINRGNVAKVFGELYYLLEYRNEELSLLYSREPARLPGNLWIIATMNTADRSIALVDAALRRRFYFQPFFPDRPPVEGLLRRWLSDKNPDFLWVADVIDVANQQLGNAHVAIGPSHFLRTDLTEDKVKLIWDYAVLPYLAEQYFGDERQLERFSLDKLRKAAPLEPAV